MAINRVSEYFFLNTSWDVEFVLLIWLEMFQQSATDLWTMYYVTIDVCCRCVWNMAFAFSPCLCLSFANPNVAVIFVIFIKLKRVDSARKIWIYRFGINIETKITIDSMQKQMWNNKITMILNLLVIRLLWKTAHKTFIWIANDILLNF